MQVKHWMLIAGLTLMAPLMVACDNKASKEEHPANSEGTTPPVTEPATPPADQTPSAPAEEGPSEGENQSE